MKAEGLEGVFAALDDVEKKVKQKGVKKGMNAATKIVARSAKDNVRNVTGLLKKSIGRKTKVYRNAGTTVGLVGARLGFGVGEGKERRDPAKYAHLVELGTAPHSLARGDKVDRKNRKGETIQGGQTAGGRMHPGAAAKPYLKPALDQNLSRVKDAIADAIKEVLA